VRQRYVTRKNEIAFAPFLELLKFAFSCLPAFLIVNVLTSLQNFCAKPPCQQKSSFSAAEIGGHARSTLREISCVEFAGNADSSGGTGYSGYADIGVKVTWGRRAK
jgi:hypothetical protein